MATKTEDVKPKTEDVKPKTEDVKPKTEDVKPKTKKEEEMDELAALDALEKEASDFNKVSLIPLL